MFKTMMLAAFVAVSMAAFAQGSPYQAGWKDDDQVYRDSADRTHYDMWKAVCKQDEELSGGDQYEFESMLNRMPSNQEAALVKGLFHARRQSVIIYDQMCAAVAPNGTATATMAMTGDDSMRPMRMIMQAPKPHDIDYSTAMDILTSRLNATESSQVENWWGNASERDKDVVIRLLKHDAMLADDPIYTSLFITWAPEPMPVWTLSHPVN